MEHQLHHCLFLHGLGSRTVGDIDLVFPGGPDRTGSSLSLPFPQSLFWCPRCSPDPGRTLDPPRRHRCCHHHGGDPCSSDESKSWRDRGVLRIHEKKMKSENTEDLTEELRRVNREIGEYPAPITGCDAKFNHLLERRSELERKLKTKNQKEIRIWEGGNLY